MAVRRTALFWVRLLDENLRELVETRSFIGDIDEALDELKEEFRDCFPDEYDRKDQHFWAQRRIDLCSIYQSARVTVYDRVFDRQRIFQIERISHFSDDPL